MKTISLHCGHWEALIAPEFGMNAISLTCKGQSVLRSPESREALAADSCVYGTPLLMPPNRTAGGTFSFDGQEYQLPINEPAFQNHLHGRVHCQTFTVMEMTETYVKASFLNRGEVFPFPFRLDVGCGLTEEGFLQEFVFTNTGETDMPLTFGLHTVFTVKEQIRVPIEKRWRVNPCYIPTGEPEALTEESQAYRDGMNPNHTLVRGFYTAASNEAIIDGFRYRVSGNFDQWVLWNADGEGGFCAIEPMCGAVNALNSGEGLLRLKPGESVRFATSISETNH